MIKKNRQRLREQRLKRFAGLFLKLGSGPDAALEVWKGTTRKSATERASKSLKHPIVQKYLQDALEKEHITPDWILGQIKSLATGSKSEQTKLRALELLGKYLKMFSESPKSQLNLNVDLTYEQANKILRHSKGLIEERPGRVTVVHDPDPA